MSHDAVLTPPADFALEPPSAVAAVPLEAASGRVPLKPDEVAALDAQVQAFIAQLDPAQPQQPPFQAAVNRVHQLGQADIEASAQLSNRLLDRPTQTLDRGLFDTGSGIGQGLIDLRRTVESLDPSRQGDLLAPRKLLGLFPLGNRLMDYFDRYQSAQSHLNAIIETLKRGKDELLRDNAAVEQEKARLWELMARLEKFIHLGRRLDQALEAKALALEPSAPQQASLLREELLFPARQRVTDLLTQMSVNIQGYLALDMVRKNNLELVKGVDRATTTTVAALRTAVTVAQALANQKLVLDQISALNTTTSQMIAHTSELLRQQGSQIAQQASSATLDLAMLQQAFNNLYAAMDAMSSYKTQALAAMHTTVNTLAVEVDKSRSHLDRVRREDSRAAWAATPSDPAGGVAL